MRNTNTFNRFIATWLGVALLLMQSPVFAATDTLELTVALDGNVLEEGTCYQRRGTDACAP